MLSYWTWAREWADAAPRWEEEGSATAASFVVGDRLGEDLFRVVCVRIPWGRGVQASRWAVWVVGGG